MKNRWLVRLAVFAMPAALAAGCSLINAYDDVKPFSDASTGGGGDVVSGGDTGTPGDSGGGDTSVTDSEPPADGGVDAQTGALVVAALTADASTVLTVLSPTLGTPLNPPEAMEAMSVVFDGSRELWYVIDTPASYVGSSAGPSTAPGDVAFLRVRVLDTHTGKWQDFERVKVPTPFNGDLVAINQHIAYKAYGADGGTQLAVVTTKDLGMAQGDAGAPISTIDLPSTVIGILGARGGDYVHAVNKTCNAGTCAFSVIPFKVTNTTQQFPAVDVPDPDAGFAAVQSLGWGSYLGGGPDNIFVYAGEDAGILEHFSANNDTRVPGATPQRFPQTGGVFRPLAISECYETAFVGEANTLNVFAVPLTANAAPVESILTNHGNSLLAYEPYSNTLYSPFTSTGEFSAFQLKGTPPVRNVQRNAAFTTAFSSLALKPYRVAVRQPLTTKCP